MPIPWSVVIALVILALAILIQHVLDDVIEMEDTFLYIIFAFLILYAGAAVAVWQLNPSLPAMAAASTAPQSELVSVDTP